MQAEDDELLLFPEEEEASEGAPEEVSSTHEDDAAVFYKLSTEATQIQVRELRSKGLSFQIWPAAHALCAYLEQTFAPSGMLTRPTSHSFCPNMRVLELGAGTGMVGILCAVLGAHTTITDLPHVIPNLEYNAILNRDVIDSSGRGGSVAVKMLRWGEQADIEGIAGSFDLIVASDVVYYDHLFEPLLCTLKWLLLAAPQSSLGKGMDIQDVAEQKTAMKISNGNGICTARKAKLEEGGASFHVVAMQETVALYPCGENVMISEHKCDVGATNGPPAITENAAWITGREKAAPTVLLAHVRRWKKDSQFFKKASKLFQVTVVHKHLHDANSRTGVTVYSFAKKRK